MEIKGKIREGKGVKGKGKFLPCLGVLVERMEGTGGEDVNMFGSLKGNIRELVYFRDKDFSWSSLPFHYPPI